MASAQTELVSICMRIPIISTFNFTDDSIYVDLLRFAGFPGKDSDR